MSPVLQPQPVWLRWSRSPVENRYPPHDALPLEAPGGFGGWALDLPEVFLNKLDSTRAHQFYALYVFIKYRSIYTRDFGIKN